MLCKKTRQFDGLTEIDDDDDGKTERLILDEVTVRATRNRLTRKSFRADGHGRGTASGGGDDDVRNSSCVKPHFGDYAYRP